MQAEKIFQAFDRLCSVVRGCSAGAGNAPACKKFRHTPLSISGTLEEIQTEPRSAGKQAGWPFAGLEARAYADRAPPRVSPPHRAPVAPAAHSSGSVAMISMPKPASPT